jgi:hypothetical protein
MIGEKEKRGIVGELIFRIIILETFLLGCIFMFHYKYRFHKKYNNRKFINFAIAGFAICSISLILVMTINFYKYKETIESLQDVFNTEDVERAFSTQKLNTYDIDGKIYEVFPEKVIGKKTGYVINGRKINIVIE